MSAYSLRLDASGSSFGLFGITKRVGQFVEDVATTLDDTIGHAFEEWQMDGSSKRKGGGLRGEQECGTPENLVNVGCDTPENILVNVGCGRGAPDMSPVSSSQCSASSSQGCVVLEEWGDFSIDDDDNDEGRASSSSSWWKEKSRLEKQMRELVRENEELKADRIDEQTRHQIERLVEEKSELKRENDRLVRENKSLSEMVAYLVACPSAMSPAVITGDPLMIRGDQYSSDCDDVGVIMPTEKGNGGGIAVSSSKECHDNHCIVLK
ncbi:hypothetical protein M9434_006409 [Picochlorum sp. BPE23]|nr:hypothetical protein M9434_006409 [Picochlorum sp. BPE23]